MALVADPGGAFVEPRDGGAQADLDARVGEPLPGPRVELVAERSGPQPVAHLEDRRPQPERGEARGDLHADEAAADHGHSGPGASLDGPRRGGPVHRTGCAAGAPLAALDVQLTWLRAGRDQAPLERDRGPVVEGGLGERRGRAPRRDVP